MNDTEIKMKEIGNQITDLKIEYERLRGNYFSPFRKNVIITTPIMKDKKGEKS